MKPTLLESVPTSVWWGLFASWIIGLVALSSIPGSHIGEMPFAMADKAAHSMLFLAGGSLLMLGIAGSFPGVSRWRIGPAAFLVMTAIGAADEFYQLHIKGRSGGDSGDFAADMVGALVGILVVIALYGKRSSTPPVPASDRDRAA